MANYRFRISDIMPKSWLCKLKNMGRRSSRAHKTAHPNPTWKNLPTPPATPAMADSRAPANQRQANPHRLSHSRKSYYFTRERLPGSPQFLDPPRRSSRLKPSRRSPRRQALAAAPPISPDVHRCGCCEMRGSRAVRESTTAECLVSPIHSSPETEPGEPGEPGEPLLSEYRSDSILPTESSDGVVSLSWSPSSCSCGGGPHSTPNDIEIDAKSFAQTDLEFRPIRAVLTKRGRNFSKTEAGGASPGRRIPGQSPVGVRLRVKSPRIASRRFHGRGGQRSVASAAAWETEAPRRSVSESFAVVKESGNPGKDFRESMMEMILQNNIWESRDLEELLACYLSLNSDGYHDLIIRVFKQIWVDLTDLRGINNSGT